jgi:hypothetical protein
MSESLLKRQEQIDKENAAKKKAKEKAAAEKRIARQLAELDAAEKAAEKAAAEKRIARQLAELDAAEKAAEKAAAEKAAAKKALVIKREKEIARQIAEIEAAEKEAAAREGAAIEITDTIESNESDILLTRYTKHNCIFRCHICESILKKGLCCVGSHNILIKKTNTKKVSFAYDTK